MRQTQTHLGETQDALVSGVVHKVGIFHAIPGIGQGQAHGIGRVLLHCLGQRLEVACMEDKKRIDYAFRRQFDEKPSIIL